MKFVSLRQQEGWYTLTEVLVWLSSPEKKEPTRYEVRLDVVQSLLHVYSREAAYEKLGCGRTSFGVGIYCLTCSKETWPPRFWIGDC